MLLLIACGAAPTPAPTGQEAQGPAASGPTATTAPTTNPAPTPTPTTAGTPRPTRVPTPPTEPITLPWPSGDATKLQAEVDRGAQPWLLDPTEVAVSYAAAQGWTASDHIVTATSTGRTTVQIFGDHGLQSELDLVQPGRTGPGGVWVVAADRDI